MANRPRRLSEIVNLRKGAYYICDFYQGTNFFLNGTTPITIEKIYRYAGHTNQYQLSYRDVTKTSGWQHIVMENLDNIWTEPLTKAGRILYEDKTSKTST